jgi:hypothetical protein
MERSEAQAAPSFRAWLLEQFPRTLESAATREAEMCNMCAQLARYGDEVPGEDDDAGTVGLTISSGYDPYALADTVRFANRAPQPQRPVRPEPPSAPAPSSSPFQARNQDTGTDVKPVSLLDDLKDMGWFDGK